LRIQAEGENNGIREKYSFNSSFGAIKKQLKDKQFPLAVTIRRAKTQKGTYYYWLE